MKRGKKAGGGGGGGGTGLRAALRAGARARSWMAWGVVDTYDDGGDFVLAVFCGDAPAGVGAK